MDFEICCICTSPTRLYINLQCQHIYCDFCYQQLFMLSEHRSSINCPICLKSNREQNSAINKNKRIAIPDQAQPSSFLYKSQNSFKNHQSNNPKLKFKDNATSNRLFCFTCEATFHTNDYINGNHRNHKVKTEQQATLDLQDQHLRSLKILECRIQDFMKKQVSLQKYLKQTFNTYKSTQEDIRTYFDELILQIQQQRDAKLGQLQQMYNNNVQIIVKNLQDLKSELKQAANCGKTIKNFCSGNLSVDQLLKNAPRIKQQLQLKTYKIACPILPKLIQTYDISFHIKNGLNFVIDNETPNNNNIKQSSFVQTKSQIETDTHSVSGIPRKVRLIQKLRNQLNPSCKILKDDYFLFQF